MTCTDFTILDALNIEVPEHCNDSPSEQADAALAVIEALFKDRAALIALGGTPSPVEHEWPLDWDGDTDSDGEPCIWLNHYHCDECNEEWEDSWSCQCNDKCPTCGHEIEPYQSDDLTKAVTP